MFIPGIINEAASSVVASYYVNDFRHKWIRTESKNTEVLLGTPDIQSLSDLSNSFGVSNQMRVVPFHRRSVISLVVLIALPLFPLILTMIPIEKIISQAIGLIF